jgi:hypothetical protein
MSVKDAIRVGVRRMPSANARAARTVAALGVPNDPVCPGRESEPIQMVPANLSMRYDVMIVRNLHDTGLVTRL